MSAARNVGLPRRTAAQALRGSVLSSSGIVPLPTGTPGTATPAHVGIADPGSPLCFYNLGDSGGVQVPTPQMAVAYAMAKDAAQDKPAFAWHVGDWGYFGCDEPAWLAQVLEAYAHVPIPLVGVPGNHDDARGGDPPIPDLATRPPLDAWMANMCALSPGAPPADPQLEYGRDTQTQPYCDWTLALDALTIIGAWSNVPSGGHLEQSQIDRLTAQLKAAPPDRPCMVSIHHPPLSIDTHHGGSQKMADALTAIFQAAGRVPELVQCGHVHDYQRHSWKLAGGTTTVIVNGAGGYHNRHPIASDYTPGMQVAPDVVCECADADHYGYLKLWVSGGKISGEYVGVMPGTDPTGADATITPKLDTFTC